MNRRCSPEELCDLLRDRLAEYGFDPGAQRVLVAFSGGVDSTVLLHVAAEALAGRVRAIHVNHHQSHDAEAWEAHCRETATKLGVPLIVEQLDDAVIGQTASEGVLRQGRYAAFSRHIAADEWLLMAHHADDQAETVLFRVLRGCGIDGLAGMPECRAFGSNRLLRPFLTVSREILVACATESGWHWIEDASNSDLRYARNFIRHRLLDPARSRWPDVTARLVDLAGTAHSLSEGLRREAQRLRTSVDLRTESIGLSLSIPELQKQEKFLADGFLRELVREQFGYAPGHIDLDTLERDVVNAGHDRVPLLKLGNAVVRRYNQRLYLTPELPEPTAEEIYWAGDPALDLSPLCRIESILPPAGGELAEPLKVTFRRGGERCHPLGRDHSQTLKRLFQEYRIEPWLRGRMPIVWRDGRIVAVGDRIRCDGSIPPLQIEWLPDREHPFIEGVS